jgi:predicted MFS family arabinose efflux permease
MLTMPIAGALVDRIPVGRIVPVGLALIIVGMFPLTQVDESTSYGVIVPALFVMGLGMGATMMPLFTAALKTLTDHEVARGSTLLNISQQISSSIGVAVLSVILTNHLNDSPVIPGTQGLPGLPDGLTETAAAIASSTADGAQIIAQLGVPQQVINSGLVEAAASFGSTFWVAWVLVVLTLVPAFFLQRKRERSHLLDEEPKPPVMIH